MTSLVPYNAPGKLLHFAPPGEEVMLLPLPVEAIAKELGGLIEEVVRYYEGVFDPESPMTGNSLKQILGILAKWSRTNLRFGDWRYEFNTLKDVSYGNISLEVLAVRRYLPVKICLNEDWLDALGLEDFDGSGWTVYTPFSFMDMLRGTMNVVNDVVNRWNNVCLEGKPYFDCPLDIYELTGRTLLAVEEVYWRGMFEPISYRRGDLYSLLAIQSIETVVPYRFDNWRFDVNITEGHEYCLIQCYIKNEYFPDLAFILFEFEVWQGEILPLDGFERYVEGIFQMCERSMIAWNRLLDGEGEQRVQHYYL